MAGNAKTDQSRPYTLIEDEHEELHGALAEVTETFQTVNNPTEQLQHALNHLVENLSAHFRREEALMEKIGYKAFEQHRRQHETLERGFREILREIEAGDCIDSTKALYKIYEDRLGKHTHHSDRLLPIKDDDPLSH